MEDPRKRQGTNTQNNKVAPVMYEPIVIETYKKTSKGGKLPHHKFSHRLPIKDDAINPSPIFDTSKSFATTKGYNVLNDEGQSR